MDTFEDLEPFYVPATRRNDELLHALLGDATDENFLQDLLSWITANARLSDGEDPVDVDTLFQPWILQRLRDIKQKAPHLYFGHFLSPLQRHFPRQVSPGYLNASMQGIEGLMDGTLGDVTPEHFLEAMRTHYQTGERCGASPGWGSLAQYYTVALGETTVITGTSSAMKSTFTQAMAVNLARQFGWQFGVFAGEHGSPGKFGRHIQEAYTDMRQADLPEEMFDDTARWVTQHFHPITAPVDVPMTIPWILTVAKIQVQRYGIKGLILDPWNKVFHQYGRESETKYIGDMLSRLIKFGVDHQMHVFIVAHPTKLPREASGEYKGKVAPPQLGNVAGSQAWDSMVDNGLSIWRDRDADSHEIEVHVLKVRNYINGHMGMTKLRLSGYRFQEMDYNPEDEDKRWGY